MPSLDMLSELIPAFVTLFVIIDPIGLVPVFIVLTQGTDTRHRRRMAIRACIASFLILAAFAWLVVANARRSNTSFPDRA